MPSRTPTRRALLLGGTGVLTLAAGCISDLETESDPGSGSDDTETEPDDEDGAENDSGTDDTDEDASDDADDEDGDDRLEYETQQYRYPETPTDPDVSLLLDSGETDEWLAERGLDEDPITEFVADVAFEDAVLVSIEADAPSHCYEMVLEEISFDEDADADDGDSEEADDDSDDDDAAETDPAVQGALDLDAAVRDETDDDEMCAQARTTVGVLVRVSVGGAPITELSARIVDDDGSEHGIGIGVASESDSGSDSASDRIQTLISDSDSTDSDSDD